MTTYKVAGLFILAALINSSYAAQGDSDKLQTGVLVEIDESTFTKTCKYEVEPKGIGKSVRNNDSGLLLWVPDQADTDSEFRIEESKIRREQRKRMSVFFEKSVARVFDCPDTVTLIYNSLASDEYFREQ